MYNTNKTIKAYLEWACVYKLHNQDFDNNGFSVYAPSISYHISYSYTSGESGKPYEDGRYLDFYMSTLKCQFSQGKIQTPLILIQSEIVQQNGVGIFYINATNTSLYRFYYSE